MYLKEGLTNIVSEGQVVDDYMALKETVNNHCFVKGGIPGCLVRPQNLGEVQKIIQWANEKKIPVTPISSGEPHLTGDSVPTYGGIAMDLRNLNKVITADRKYRVAMVEPGVTFYQLKKELNGVGLRLPMPLSPRKSKSVLGSVLEREPITIPKYHIDMSAPLLCVEVVFGTGDIFRTGEASGPGTIEEQWKAGRKQKWDSGPGQVSYVRFIQGAQGGLGVVTWATLRCEVLPTQREFLFIPGESIEDFIGFVYGILRLKLGDECFILNGSNAASLLQGGADFGLLREELPPWLLVLGISGYEIFPEERISYQKNEILNIASQFGLLPRPSISGISAKRLLESLEEPSEPYWKLKPKGASCDIFFLTTLDKVSKFISLMYQISNDHRYDIRDLGIYVQPIQQGRSCHCEFNLIYDPNDLKEVDKIKKLFSIASRAMMKEGGFFSRPYGSWAQMAYNKDAGSREAVRNLKKIFDPNNIMNPGKLC